MADMKNSLPTLRELQDAAVTLLGYQLGGWRLALLAMLAGVAGAVLYDFELAAVGLMLGALFLMRRRSIFQLLGKRTAARQQTYTE